MAPRKTPPPPPIEPGPAPHLIDMGNVDDGVVECVTCKAGTHVQQEGDWQRIDEDFRWANCDQCGARPLNNAQRADIIKIMKGDGQALIGAAMGSRKTGTSVAVMNIYRGVWLLAVPLHTMSQWAGAVAEWAPEAEVHLMDARNKTDLIDLKEARGGFSIHIIGWEKLRRRDLKGYKYIDGAILDEVHRMSGHGTLTAKAVWKINATYRIALSATPANNKLYGLFNVLQWIWWGNKDHKQKNIFRRFAVYRGTNEKPGWLLRHFHTTPSEYGGPYSIDIGEEKVFHSVVDEIPNYIQHLENETCCEWHPGGVNASLPGKEDDRIVFCDMTPAQARIYKRASSDKSILWLEDKEAEKLDSTIIKGGVQRIRQREIALAVPSIREVTKTDANGVSYTDKEVYMADDAQSGKLDALESLLADITHDDDPVLVLTHSKKFAEIAVRRLRASNEIEYPVALYSGDVKDADRKKILTWFGRPNGPYIMVAVISAIAEGTDGLQEVCRQEVWLSWDDNGTNTEQASGRLPRTGQRRRTRRWEIVTRDTLEMEIIDKQKQDRRNLRASLKAS